MLPGLPVGRFSECSVCVAGIRKLKILFLAERRNSSIPRTAARMHHDAQAMGKLRGPRPARYPCTQLRHSFFKVTTGYSDLPGSLASYDSCCSRASPGWHA